LIREIDKRRENFNLEYSAPVVMSDGQTWYLPKPWLAIHPVFENGKPVDHWTFYTYGPEIESLIELIEATDDSYAKILACVGVGAHLLKWNYDLSDDELSEVFIYAPGDGRSGEMLREIIDIATGRSGPKA
jgi:hypothetical protein